MIPAYNEERRLPAAVESLRAFIERGTAEVLLVENGSTDRTAQIVDATAAADGRFRAIHLASAGKGRAVREGMLASTGRIVAFCDADFSMSIEQLDRLRGAIEAGADVAVASREAPGAVRIGEPARRHLMGRVFNFLVRMLAVPGLSDTQCGFKAFRGEVAHDLFSRQILDGWAFDVEVLFIARRRGYRMAEVPITWRYDPSSRVHPIRDTVSMVRELLSLRWYALCGRYDR